MNLAANSSIGRGSSTRRLIRNASLSAARSVQTNSPDVPLHFLAPKEKY
jgi:hypothetical protein